MPLAVHEIDYVTWLSPHSSRPDTHLAARATVDGGGDGRRRAYEAYCHHANPNPNPNPNPINPNPNPDPDPDPNPSPSPNPNPNQARLLSLLPPCDLCL